MMVLSASKYKVAGLWSNTHTTSNILTVVYNIGKISDIIIHQSEIYLIIDKKI